MATETHLDTANCIISGRSLYINNVVISPCSYERREQLRLMVWRTVFHQPIIMESAADIFTENPLPCPF